MNNSVSGPLKMVIGILAVLLIGMLLLYTVINVLFPNVMNQVIGNIEVSIKSMTGFEIDIDGNGFGKKEAEEAKDKDKTYDGGDKVEGWTKED